MVVLAQGPERAQRSRMSLEQFLALGDDVRAEFVDGEVVVTPPATHGHNRAQFRLARVLDDALGPALSVVPDAGWSSTPTRRRVPDIAVFAEQTPDDVQFADAVPVLVVEVLSPSTRAEDTLRKSEEYARAGVGQYWVLDRELRTLTVLVAVGSGWRVEAEFDDAFPVGRVTVPGHGPVPIDLLALLAP